MTPTIATRARRSALSSACIVRVIFGPWLAALSRLRDELVAAACALAALIVYIVSAWGHETVYDYFGRLAIALRRGEYWLDGAPPHLNELVVGQGGHVYAVTPPLPAILLVPFVGLADPAVLQTALSVLCGAASAAPLYLALRAMSVPRSLAVTVTLLGSFGTGLWVSAVDGRSWFAADAVAVLFSSIAMCLAARRAKPVLIGAAVGAAALARLPLALAAPGLLFLAFRGADRRVVVSAVAMFVVGALPFALIQVAYNLARWGTPFDIGYALLSADDPFYAQGLFSLAYVPRHLYAIFFEPPSYVDGSPFFLRARSVGMSLLITTPAMLWLARAALVGRVSGAASLAISCLAILPDVLFGTVGFEQYGYRRSLDVQPFLLGLIAVGAGSTGGSWDATQSVVFRAAVLLSVLVTAYFLIEIRLYGFL